jgi:hypothetical protein
MQESATILEFLKGTELAGAQWLRRTLQAGRITIASAALHVALLDRVAFEEAGDVPQRTSLFDPLSYARTSDRRRKHSEVIFARNKPAKA